MNPVTPIGARTVVQALREALGRAERGELRSVAVCYETQEASGHLIGIGKTGLETTLIGEMEACKLSLLVESGRLHPKGT